MLNLLSYYLSKLAEHPKNILSSQLGYDFEWEKILEFKKTFWITSIENLSAEDKLYLLEIEASKGSGGFPYGNYVCFSFNNDYWNDHYRFSMLYCVNGTLRIMTNWSGITWPDGSTTYYSPTLGALFASLPARVYVRSLVVVDSEEYPSFHTIAVSSNQDYTTLSIASTTRLVSESVNTINFRIYPYATYVVRLYRPVL